LETYKRDIKTLRSELNQLCVDRPYYVSGSGGVDADDKVDDDALRRQQRGRDWAAVDDPSKVSIPDTDTCHTVTLFSHVPIFCR